jgi:hypothetical protein
MLKEQIIDVTRSFLVTDPEAFYENQMVSQREDSPEKMLPIVAYEGYNFLPTLYGYRSYFDATSKLDIGSLASRCDRIVLYQFANYQNILVALCEDGIWTNSGGTAAEAWNHRVTLSTPGVGSYLEWTFCVIENTLYMYRQGGGSVYTVKPTSYALGNPVENFAPSFLNMSGQMGIFRANGRLGFWDSANSVSWSSLFSFSDFTPSVETLAGFAIFNDILGRIVTIKSHGSGFIIYSTKNIVGVSYEATGSVLFSARTIAEVAGIWTSKQVCSGAVDTEQFAYTNTGIKHISAGFKIEDIFPGVYDFLKESREPVYLDFLNGRYLFLSLINPDYISGKVSFEISALGSMTVRFLYNGAEVTDAEDLPSEVDGLGLGEALARDLTAGPGTTGLYAQWAASGSKLVPGRVSSMEPYELDDPFTPEDDFPYARNTTPLYSTAELINARDIGIWTDKFSMDNTTPMSLDLGWHNAPLGLNRTDSGLTRMKLRQKEEWDEYIALAADVQSEIVTLGSANSLVLGDVIYGGGGPSLASDTGWVSIGDLTTGDDAAPITETFGTGSYEYKKSFSKKAAIERRVEVVDDSEHQVTVPHIHWYSPSGTAYDFGYGLLIDLWIHNCSTTVLPTWVYEPAMPTGIWEYDRPGGYEQSASEREAIFAAIKVFAASWFTPPPSLPTRNFDHAVITDNANTYRVEYYYKNIHDVITHEFTLIAFYAGYFQPTGIHRKYGIKTVSLRTGSATASGSDYSILSGTQEYVDWGLWLEDAPNPDFPYDTNSLDLGNIGDIDLSSRLPNSLTVTYPGATFLLQNATTAPIYPDFAGALVYDLPLQKWGKAKCTYRCLMDYSPINSNVEQVINYTNFGLTAGLLAEDGFLRLFSANCTDSFIRYGKLAFSRIGYTYPEELVVNFRLPFSGSIQTDVSMDGRSIHAALAETTAFTGVGTAKVYPSYSGQWHTFAVSGNFDIRSISYTGRVSGIR